jgi:uncharacterized Zn-finger protein
MSAKPKEKKSDPKATVVVTAKDLHGHGVVFCPNPKMALWSAHPKVYLDLSKSGEASCPYCGTHYRLEGEIAAH